MRYKEIFYGQRKNNGGYYSVSYPYDYRSCQINSLTCNSCEYSIKKSSENKNNSVLCSYEYQQDKLYINNSPYALGITCPSVRLEIKTDKIYLNKKEFKKL